MSLGIVVSEEKSLTRTYTPQSDDIKIHPEFRNLKQEESARERALCQLTECFWFVKVIRGQNNYQEKGCTEIQ